MSRRWVRSCDIGLLLCNWIYKRMVGLVNTLYRLFVFTKYAHKGTTEHNLKNRIEYEVNTKTHYIKRVITAAMRNPEEASSAPNLYRPRKYSKNKEKFQGI